MREFLTKGFFGAILGLLVGAPADASLISRSFLDQALTDYATNTALDLKADNADLTNLSNKIGELPSDETVANMLSWQEAIGLPLNVPFIRLLFNTNENSKNPKTVKEAIEVLFQCNSSPGSSGPCLPVMAGNIFSGQTLSDEILNSYEFKKNYPGLTEYKGLLQLTADIGTLPSGNFPRFSDSKQFFSWLKQPFTYPTSLAELITAIYGNSETGGSGLLAAIITGFQLDTDGDGSPDEYAGLVPNFYIAKAAKSTAQANTAKIGDLPAEYATVGAALTAMDAKIDARELPSSSDDGQYVLSAKKVGDTITYTWVRMDLTSEEQAQ